VKDVLRHQPRQGWLESETVVYLLHACIYVCYTGICLRWLVFGYLLG